MKFLQDFHIQLLLNELKTRIIPPKKLNYFITPSKKLNFAIYENNYEWKNSSSHIQHTFFLGWNVDYFKII